MERCGREAGLGRAMETLSGLLSLLTLAGVLQGLMGWAATIRFARRARPPAAGAFPSITVLKPLHGDEPLLAEALATLCEQDYPADVQIVFGVHSAADPALRVVEALRARFPERDIAVVADGTRHGANPKVGNLINMFPSARHDVLVIADSDVHARPDYLRQLAAALATPGTGLATTVYTGLPAFRSLPALLGTTQITHGFLPGALMARALGRQDCLGATMALTRRTLSRLGGFARLKDHLADDNVLGRLVCAQGLTVALADTVVATTVPERTLAALWRHEMRWARTIRTMEPAGFAASAIQYTLFWALLALLVSAGASSAWLFFLAVWAVRALTVVGIDEALRGMRDGLALRSPVWLLPLRDILSAAEWAVSHAGRRVDWRGQALEADTPHRPAARDMAARVHTKGSHAR